MADHNAHTYFGLRVLEQLPADLRTHVSGDMPAFHLGLYGPDPLIFSLLTKHISDRLHKNWRTESLPGLSKALQKGSATARSFAGGYVLHQLLDDTVHPQIYQWMEEGSSSCWRRSARPIPPRSAPRGKTAPPWLQQGCWPPWGHGLTSAVCGGWPP